MEIENHTFVKSKPWRDQIPNQQNTGKGQEKFLLINLDTWEHHFGKKGRKLEKSRAVRYWSSVPWKTAHNQWEQILQSERRLSAAQLPESFQGVMIITQHLNLFLKAPMP